MKKILLAAPVRQSADVFEEYQKGLDRLIIPEGYSVDRFFIVNDCPEVVPIIRNAAYIIHDTDDEYIRLQNDHLWTEENVNKMSDLRNMTIYYAMKNGYDYLLSVDTDLVLDPHTLEWLLKADKDIVSEAFWTRSDSGTWSNSWMFDQSESMGMTDKWREPGLYQVGFTGALILISRRVFEAGVSYAKIPNIRRAVFGEDRHFCIRAACEGFTIWMDTHAPATHLYTRDAYEAYMEKQRGEGNGEQCGTDGGKTGP